MRGTVDVIDGLRAEGFAVTRTYLGFLIRDRWFSPPEKAGNGAMIWTDADVQRLRSLLIRRGRWTWEPAKRGLPMGARISERWTQRAFCRAFDYECGCGLCCALCGRERGDAGNLSDGRPVGERCGLALDSMRTLPRDFRGKAHGARQAGIA